MAQEPSATQAEPDRPLRVKIEVFDGPFDLLLHLVRVNEMDIFDINIAEITQQYLDHLRLMEERNLAIGGEFLVMASTLLNIKSRNLLPDNPYADDDQPDDEQQPIRSRQDLIRQLIEYRRFKEIAQLLAERELAQMRLFYRTHISPWPPRSYGRHESGERRIPDQTLDALLGAFARVLSVIRTERRHEVIDENITLDEKLAWIRQVLNEHNRVRLLELMRRCPSKMDMIVTVLALLELARLGEITLEQAKPFADLLICKRSSLAGQAERPQGGAANE